MRLGSWLKGRSIVGMVAFLDVSPACSWEGWPRKLPSTTARRGVCLKERVEMLLGWLVWLDAWYGSCLLGRAGRLFAFFNAFFVVSIKIYS